MFFPKLFNHGNLRSVKVEDGKVTFEGVYGKETFEGGSGDVHGIPSGGTAGQVLSKTSSTDYEADWSDVNQVPTGGTQGQVLTKGADGYGWETPSAGGGGGFEDFAVRIEASFVNPAVGQSAVVNDFSASSILKGDVTKWTNGAYCNVYLQIWNSNELRYYDVSGVGLIQNNSILFTAVANPFTNSQSYNEVATYTVRAKIRLSGNFASGQLVLARLI